MREGQLRQLLFGFLLVAAAPIYVHSQKPAPPPLRVTVNNGFLKGEEFLNMNTNEKHGYAIGMIDGMLAAPMFFAPEEKVQWLDSCITKMSDEQITAILTKYVRDNPAQWHYGMNVISFNAMRQACPHSQD